jgi:hypothetical protein
MAKHPVPKKKTSKARTSRRYKAFKNRVQRYWANKYHGSKARFARQEEAKASATVEEAKVKTIKAD